MNKTIEERLKDANIGFEDLPTPGGNYVSVNVRANIAYVAIQFPIKNNHYFYQGRLGKDLSTAEGVEASRICAINILGHINKYVGFDRIVGLNHLDIYYQQDNNWDEGPVVADGASTLFVQILGERGVHSRAIFGVQNLPRNFSVGIVSSFTIRV